MLETPRTVCTCHSSCSCLSAVSVIAACFCWALTVMVRQSIATSSRRIPASTAASSIRFAYTRRSSTVSGILRPSSVSPTTAAPYFFARGSTRLRLSSEAFTLLIRHLPGAARSPASSASGFEESICSGSMEMPDTAITTARIIAGSSMPGTPTLISSICAPASSCVTARFSASLVSPSRSVFANALLPVGLMRSPMG